ncbi:MAG TPA: hypothetical protein VMG12_28520, partial [Polyangiaceae bacterium]|nr:hypothetical protein [Polyangiaceae bacterium]
LRATTPEEMRSVLAARFAGAAVDGLDLAAQGGQLEQSGSVAIDDNSPRRSTPHAAGDGACA